jgi:hypothetical protein
LFSSGDPLSGCGLGLGLRLLSIGFRLLGGDYARLGQLLSFELGCFDFRCRLGGCLRHSLIFLSFSLLDLRLRRCLDLGLLYCDFIGGTSIGGIGEPFLHRRCACSDLVGLLVGYRLVACWARLRERIGTRF